MINGRSGEAGEGLVDGVPPPVRPELLSGHLEHPVSRRFGVERGGGVEPGVGRVLVAGERRIDVVVAPQRGEIEHRQDGNRNRHEGADPTPPRPHSRHERPGTECEAERRHRYGAGAAPKGERQPRRRVVDEQIGDRRRVVERVHANGEQDTGSEDQQREPPVRPAS